MESSRKIEYLKDATFFKRSDEGSAKYKSFLEMGRNGGKAIFFKNTSSQSKKPWLSKQPVIANEIICSEAFRILLGKSFSPKYRISMGEEQYEKKVMTKLLPNFTPWSELREKIDLIVDDSSFFKHRSDDERKLKYQKNALKYLNVTPKLRNFNRMVAVCLLFGKDDLHSGNWGVVNVDGTNYAATVDHGQALKKGFCMYGLLYSYGHRKEQVLTTQFVDACREVLADYELNKDAMKEVMAECIDEIKLNLSKVPSIEDVMNALEFNKALLFNLSYQIEAELAIKKGNPSALRNALMNLPNSYFPKEEDDGIGSPATPIISKQNYSDGFLDCYGMSLRGFIKIRNICERDNLRSLYSSSNGVVTVQQGVQMSSEDIRIENELLAVYDEVEKDKRNANIIQLGI